MGFGVKQTFFCGHWCISGQATCISVLTFFFLSFPPSFFSSFSAKVMPLRPQPKRLNEVSAIHACMRPTSQLHYGPKLFSSFVFFPFFLLLPHSFLPCGKHCLNTMLIHAHILRVRLYAIFLLNRNGLCVCIPFVLFFSLLPSILPLDHWK